MYGQIIELIIFALVAFFVISKLVSILGNVSDDDVTKDGKGLFGESSKINDLSKGNSGFFSDKSNIIDGKFKFLQTKKSDIDDMISDFIVVENKTEIITGLDEVHGKFPSFSIKRFIEGSKIAFQMILEAAHLEDKNTLSELVDKRYIDSFLKISKQYGKCDLDNNKDLVVKLSEIYMFGNNIFIKVIFTGTNITSDVSNLHEEWTFIKNILASGNQWYLSNIDRPQ